MIKDAEQDFIEAKHGIRHFRTTDKPKSALIPLHIALAQLEGRKEEKVVDILQLNLARSYCCRQLPEICRTLCQN